MSRHQWRYRGAAGYWDCACGVNRIWGYEYDGAIPNDNEYCEGAKKKDELKTLLRPDESNSDIERTR